MESKANGAEKAQGLDIADYLLKFDFQKWKLEELIKLQFEQYTPNYWILNKEKDLNLTIYNLQVLCDDLYYKYKVKVLPDDYYNAFISLN